MEEIKIKIVEELEELGKKATKLEAFINSNNFRTITVVQQVLLKVQLEAMFTYMECLNQRINNL